MANGLPKSKATTSAMNHAFSGKTCRKVPAKEQYRAMRNALKPGGELRLHCTIEERAKARANKILVKQKVEELLNLKNKSQPDQPVEKNVKSKQVALGKYLEEKKKPVSYSHAFLSHIALQMAKNSDKFYSPEELVEDEYFNILNTKCGPKLMHLTSGDLDVDQVVRQAKNLLTQHKFYENNEGNHGINGVVSGKSFSNEIF